MKFTHFTLLAICLSVLVSVAVSDKILFVALPLYGHFNPVSHLALEMQSRGHRVFVASGNEFIAQFEHQFEIVNATELSVDMVLVRNQWAKKHLRLALWEFLISINDLYIDMFVNLDAWVAENKPDLIVCDYMTIPGIDVALKHGIKLVVNKPGLLAPVEDFHIPATLTGWTEMNVLQKFVSTVLKLSQLTSGTAFILLNKYGSWKRQTNQNIPFVWEYYEDSMKEYPRLINLVFGAELPQHISPLVHMVGHIEAPNPAPLTQELEQWLERSKPVVFANFGTSGFISSEKFATILEGLALAHQKCNFSVLWRVPKEDIDTIPKQLPNFVRVEHWLPSQISVLRSPHVKLFITHAGVNSPYEALSNGIPLLSIPIIADQVDHAARLEHQKLSIRMDRDSFTSSQIANAVETLLTSPVYAAAALKLSKILKRRGLKYAADILEEVLEVGYDHLIPHSYRQIWFKRLGIDMYFLFLVVTVIPIASIKYCVSRKSRSSYYKKKIE